jgi:hypothetical protein
MQPIKRPSSFLSSLLTVVQTNVFFRPLFKWPSSFLSSLLTVIQTNAFFRPLFQHFTYIWKLNIKFDLKWADARIWTLFHVWLTHIDIKSRKQSRTKNVRKVHKSLWTRNTERKKVGGTFFFKSNITIGSQDPPQL